MITANDTLVLMPCGARKLDMRSIAIEMYQGPLWSTLRKHLGVIPFGNVCVLSAEYGFINALDWIGPYDRQLSKAAAQHLIAKGVMHRNDRFGRVRDGCTSPSAWVQIGGGARGNNHPYTCVIQAGAGNYADVFNAFIGELVAYKAIAFNAPVFKVAGPGKGIGVQRSLLMHHLQLVNERTRLRRSTVG